MPGRRQHTPRTIMSIGTPACEARYRILIIAVIGDRVVLDDHARRPAGLGVLDLALDQRAEALAQADRRHQQRVVRAAVRIAGQRVEHLGDVVERPLRRR